MRFRLSFAQLKERAEFRPVKPCQQVHVKPPTVLLHVLLAPQLSVPLTHSLMSVLQCGPSNLHSKASDTDRAIDRGLLKDMSAIPQHMWQSTTLEPVELD